jgi:hypothetical protein
MDPIDQSDPRRERARLAVVLTTIACAVLWVVIVATSWPGSDGWSAVAICLFNNAILIAYVLRTRDRVIARLLLFGLTVGIVELAADAWLVDVTRTLDYSISGSALVWRSPWWMILAWELVAVQFGYIGLRLYERFGNRGLLLAGLLGSVNIPFYEEMALQLGWWRYSNCPMLSNTPYYIIAGEFVLIMGFGVLAWSIRRGPAAKVVRSGAMAGAGIFAAYFGAWYVVEWLTR